MPSTNPAFSKLTPNRFAIEFQDTAGAPLPSARVRVQTLDKDSKPAITLLDGRSDAAGKIAIGVPQATTPQGQPAPLLPKLRVAVLDLDGAELSKTDLQPEAGKPIPAIKVSTQAQQDKLAANI